MKPTNTSVAIAVLTFVCILSIASHTGQTDAAFVSTLPVQNDTTKTTAIVGATLIEGSGRRPLANSVVLINGDSIVAAGSRTSVKVPADATVINAKGLIIAPGFIDTHNHSDRGLTRAPGAP